MAFNFKHIKPLVTFKKGREYQIIRRPENLKTILKQASNGHFFIVFILERPPPLLIKPRI
jgi:hypothetical protein